MPYGQMPGGQMPPRQPPMQPGQRYPGQPQPGHPQQTPNQKYSSLFRESFPFLKEMVQMHSSGYENDQCLRHLIEFGCEESSRLLKNAISLAQVKRTRTITKEDMEYIVKMHKHTTEEIIIPTQPQHQHYDRMQLVQQINQPPKV